MKAKRNLIQICLLFAVMFVIFTAKAQTIITASPTSQPVLAGKNATFSVTVSFNGYVGYQWYKNGVPLIDMTDSTLTLYDVQPSSAGGYSVGLSYNETGLPRTERSSTATLTVVVPPTINTQPASQTIAVGNTATFSVSASGTGPFGYQWQFNNTNILNTTNATYTISSVATNDNGNYLVIVWSQTDVGFLVGASSAALLTVLIPPTMTLQFSAGYPQLNLNGMLSSNFMVQYSTNLAGTNWINLRSISNLSSNPYQFIDPAGVVPPARFYRVYMQ